MHRVSHALVSCVAWLSLLLHHGNAAKGIAPSELLSHFAQSINAGALPAADDSHNEVTPLRKQVDVRQAITPNVGGLRGGQDLRFAAQAFPQEYHQPERAYQYGYPPFSEQIAPNFYPGSAGAFGGQHGLPGGLPFDPSLFRQQALGNVAGRPLGQLKPGFGANLIDSSGNHKEPLRGNANTIQNLDGNGDSKSSAQQNRPFDGQDFGTLPFSPDQGDGIDPTRANLGLDNRFQGVDYERIRQNNYFNDPSIDQQRNYYSSFNDVPFNAGPPYRSPLGGDRYPNLGYNDGGRDPSQGGGFRSGNGLAPGGGGNIFGLGFQPYSGSFNYNGGSAGGPGGGGVGLGPESFPSGGGGSGGRPGFYPNPAAGPGFSNSPLRASSSRESSREVIPPRQSLSSADDVGVNTAEIGSSEREDSFERQDTAASAEQEQHDQQDELSEQTERTDDHRTTIEDEVGTTVEEETTTEQSNLA
ncbi:hypothetical protein QAD02_016439 [Eretmocerus hayati]|uniref:Uncharacterized protein n=1 Tax=Eretmocerus hayati TaxID=131215 RepID=A0ACC2PDX7_9HYME|nr:hypothetical protein QAD02_016439 [Eretmocerus hayati]